jgi:hypothetical protein
MSRSWSPAEHTDKATPERMQRLLTMARWDVDPVRGDVRGYMTAMY